MQHGGHSTLQLDELVSRYDKELVSEGLLTPDQLTIAKISRENLGTDLGGVLIRKGFLTEEKLLSFVADKVGVAYVSIDPDTLDATLTRKLPVHLARQHKVIPFAKEKDRVRVAMANPYNSFALDDLRDLYKCEIEPCLASLHEIEEALDHCFETESPDEEKFLSIEVVPEIDSHNEIEARKMQELALGPKVVATVNNMIARAKAEGASDIHIEPDRDRVLLRYRIDGMLRERGMIAKGMLLPVVSRVKILSGMDIAERRLPQDGRIRVQIVGKPLDLRISTCPTQHGEKIVIRLLSMESLRNIEDLGFNEHQRHLFSDIITKSHGIFLVTGPTGSGKSTTLYAALMRINSSEKNIISIEDPIENEIAGITQVAVNPKVGLTFASVLRSVLRQDPDVIMLGEIRDAETAQIAVRSAITGHMVLSTLHTNTAGGAVSRLMDLGVESFLLASALRGVMAQRLVRKICTHCREEVDIDAKRLGALKGEIQHSWKGKGCASCHYTGFLGRLGIFELAPVNDAVSALIHDRAPDSLIIKNFRQMGVKSILHDGLSKVNQGVTTIEEVLRVTSED